MLGFLAINFFSILGIKSLERSYKNKFSFEGCSLGSFECYIQVALSYGPGVVIFLVNQLAKWLFSFLAAQGKFASKTEEYAVASQFQSYLSIVNSILSLLVVTYFFSIIFREDEVDEGKNNILTNFSSRWYLEISPNLFVALVSDIVFNSVLPYVS